MRCACAPWRSAGRSSSRRRRERAAPRHGQDDGIRCLRSPRPLQRRACGLLRGSPENCGGLRSRRVLRLSSRRAPRDAARHGALAERVPRRRGAAYDAASLRSAGVADAAPPPATADRGNLHARPVERRAPRNRLRARRRADRARILRRRSAGRAGDLHRGGRARAQGADPQGARLQGPAIFLQRRADGNRAAAETASPDLVWRSRAGERRARRAPQSQRGQSRSAERNPALHRSLSRRLAASSRAHGHLPQARPRPLHRRGAERCGGVCFGAPRLPRLARKLHAFVPPARTAAIASPSCDLRFVGRARAGRRRRAVNGGSIPRLPARRNRLQLRGRTIRLRRFDPRAKPAVDRSLRPRGDAARARHGGRRCDGDGRRCRAWAPLISSLSPTGLPELALSTMESSRIRLAADVGGTFTDVAAFDETTGELRLGKALTTPARLVTGVENGVTKAGAGFSGARLFLHGTTVAINIILERTGAPCALLTTQGFRDIYEIGRVNRPESYNLFFRRHQPLIERDLRYE